LHHVLYRPHHGFETTGNLFISGSQAPHALALGVEILKQLVALIGKVTKLFLQVSERNGAFSSGKYLTDEILKLIDRRIKPLCCLLQSLGLSHGDFPSVQAPPA
jgi:hypothetical protein